MHLIQLINCFCNYYPYISWGYLRLEVQQQAYGQLNEPFSIQSLQRRAFNGHLLDRIIAHLEVGESLNQSSPLYQTLCNYGTIDQKAA